MTKTLFILILLFTQSDIGSRTIQAAAFFIDVQCVDNEAVPPNYYISTHNGNNEPVTIYVEFFSQWGNVLAFGDWLIDRESGTHIWGGVAIDVNSGVNLQALSENGAVLATLIINGNETYPQCGVEGWQPGAPSILIEPPPGADCYFVQVIDSYENWHWVESNGQRVLLHYGETLIGNSRNGQRINPDDYRAVATACPG